MRRMVLFVLLLCAGCNPRQPTISLRQDDCPFPALRALPCAEAVRAVTELQQAVDRVRALQGYVPAVWVRLISAPIFGSHHYILEQGGRIELRVTESFLRQPNRTEVIERYVCEGVQTAPDSEGIAIRRCMLQSALAAGETERARWLLRTLPPGRVRPILRQDLRRTPERGCGVPCAT